MTGLLGPQMWLPDISHSLHFSQCDGVCRFESLSSILTMVLFVAVLASWLTPTPNPNPWKSYTNMYVRLRINCNNVSDPLPFHLASTPFKKKVISSVFNIKRKQDVLV